MKTALGCKQQQQQQQQNRFTFIVKETLSEMKGF